MISAEDTWMNYSHLRKLTIYLEKWNHKVVVLKGHLKSTLYMWQRRWGPVTCLRPCSQMVAKPGLESTSSSIQQPHKNTHSITNSQWRMQSKCKLYMIRVRKWKSLGLLGIFTMQNRDCCLLLNCFDDCYFHGSP